MILKKSNLAVLAIQYWEGENKNKVFDKSIIYSIMINKLYKF